MISTGERLNPVWYLKVFIYEKVFDIRGTKKFRAIKIKVSFATNDHVNFIFFPYIIRLELPISKKKLKNKKRPLSK